MLSPPRPAPPFRRSNSANEQLIRGTRPSTSTSRPGSSRRPTDGREKRLRVDEGVGSSLPSRLPSSSLSDIEERHERTGRADLPGGCNATAPVPFEPATPEMFSLPSSRIHEPLPASSAGEARGSFTGLARKALVPRRWQSSFFWLGRSVHWACSRQVRRRGPEDGPDRSRSHRPLSRARGTTGASSTT